MSKWNERCWGTDAEEKYGIDNDSDDNYKNFLTTVLLTKIRDFSRTFQELHE